MGESNRRVGLVAPDDLGAVRRRRLRSGEPKSPAVVVTSDLTLVAEAIAAALAHHGFRATFVPWAAVAAARGAPDIARDHPEVGAVDVVLVVRDLGSPVALRAVREWGPAARAPWVVMSDSTRGPTWGGALESGARAVVAGSSALSDVVATLLLVARGGSSMSASERVELVRAWRWREDRRGLLRARVASLSQRELQVLGLLHEGTTVRQIASLLAISEATVRSQVRAVLRKLAVDSQLAAVAVLNELAEDPGDWS